MGNAKRILLVDDQESILDLYESILHSWGYETKRAKDGYEALAKLVLDFDLVILDLEMPGMDGFTVTRNIRQSDKFSDIPIIISTGLTDKKTRLRVVEFGANDYIAKPLDRTELQVRIASLLKLKESQDAVKQYQAELEEKIAQRTASLRRAWKRWWKPSAGLTRRTLTPYFVWQSLLSTRTRIPPLIFAE